MQDFKYLILFPSEPGFQLVLHNFRIFDSQVASIAFCCGEPKAVDAHCYSLYSVTLFLIKSSSVVCRIKSPITTPNFAFSKLDGLN